MGCSCTEEKYKVRTYVYVCMHACMYIRIRRTYCYMHECTGLTVDCYWLRNEFLQLLNEHHPNHQFRLSNGWLAGFCLRFPITNQMTTEKKYKSIEERLNQIENFHRLMYRIQNDFPEVRATYVHII